MPVTQVIPRELSLAAGELEEADNLLLAVIQHWTRLGNATPAGLRETFLQREGKLILAPNTGAITLALPAAASCTNKGYIIKKTTSDAQAVTIDPDASETIDGGANYAAVDAANDLVEIVSNGTAWYIISKSIA
jgi:hypothetical protein